MIVVRNIFQVRCGMNPSGLNRLIALAALLVLVGCEGKPYPEFLRKQAFKIHRPDLERLVQMSNSDYARTGVTRIAPDFTRLENDWSWPRDEGKWGIDRARWDKYRRLFKAADLPAGIERESLQVLFPTYLKGIVVHGSEEGVLWSPYPPKPIVDPREVFEVKHLDGNWYLYYWGN